MPTPTVACATNGSLAQLTGTQLGTLYGAGNVKTPTKDFTLNYKGHHVQFFNGVPVVCDAQLLAALTAISAPVV